MTSIHYKQAFAPKSPKKPDTVKVTKNLLTGVSNGQFSVLILLLDVSAADDS